MDLTKWKKRISANVLFTVGDVLAAVAELNKKNVSTSVTSSYASLLVHTKKVLLAQDWLPFHCFGTLISSGLTSYENDLFLTALKDLKRKTFADTSSISVSRTKDILSFLYQENANKKVMKKSCTGRESNPGLPRGRREFYHWTTSAYTYTQWICRICLKMLKNFQNSLKFLGPKFILLNWWFSKHYK